MSSDLFKQGGPYQIKKTDLDKYSLSISIPKDADGRIARECPNQECSPGLFKVKPGTGIADGSQMIAFCPYCREQAKPSDFTTKEQIRYAKDIATREAHAGIERMLKESLGLDHRGKRRLVGGLINVDVEMKPSWKLPVRPPYADLLRRDVLCPACGLDQSVYGLATWCSDCGKDIFTTHIRREIGVVETILNDIPRRNETFGLRVAASDIENALEDLVSIFEATLKYEIRRYAALSGASVEEIENRFKKIGSRLQSVKNAQSLLPEHCGGNGFEEADAKKIDHLDLLFQKRHPITHNLGVIDRKYLGRMQSGELEGREVRITSEAVEEASFLTYSLLEDLHLKVHPNATKAKAS